MHLETRHKLLAALRSADRRQNYALAVSGGGDSMAMLHAMAQLRELESATGVMFVFTVDHGLRPESRQEADFVATYCKERGIPHEILDVGREEALTGQQAGARNARLRLLREACLRVGARQLLMAHTLDDRLETLLMRVARGGFRGHGSISNQTLLDGLCLLRPLLEFRRSELREFLANAGVGWCDDPTNQNMNYERPRRRVNLERMEKAGRSALQMLNYADVMQRFRAVMATDIAAFLSEHVELDRTCAGLSFPSQILIELPKPVAVEVIREIVRFVGGDAYMIDFQQSERVYETLLMRASKTVSVGRCLLKPIEKSRWLVRRADRNLPVISVQPGQQKAWDGRFVITTNANADSAIDVRPSQDLSTLPRLKGNTLRCKIEFEPKVLRGPQSSADHPIFDALRRFCYPFDQHPGEIR